MCRAGCALPAVPSAQHQPLRGFVQPVLWYVPRLRAVSLRGSRVLPRRRHRSPRLSQRLRSSLHSSLPPSLLTGSGSMSRTSDKPSAQNRTRSHGGGENQTNQQQNQQQCQAGVVALRALSGAAALGAVAARAAARSLPGRERRARAGASAEQPARVTAALSDRLLAKSEGTVTLFLAEHH